MANESYASLAQKINEEIDKMFHGLSSITKDKFKQAITEYRKSSTTTNADVNRTESTRSHLLPSDLKQKMCQLLESELDKITSTNITKEQAKDICSCLCHSNASPREQHFQSALKEQFNKLNLQQVNAEQARDILRNIRQEMRPNHMRTRSESSMIDDRVKDEFLKDFKAKHGNEKINADEAWELLKAFDKKHHEKTHESWEKEKEKKWNEMFDEQCRELFGDAEKVQFNQQQLEDLAKKVREKWRNSCEPSPGKRFCPRSIRDEHQ